MKKASDDMTKATRRDRIAPAFPAEGRQSDGTTRAESGTRLEEGNGAANGGRAYFVSDLHLFASRSMAHLWLEAIQRAARDARLFVLGGDIFDFRWAHHGSLGYAVEAAAVWLAELARACPECRFEFLLGNHDYHQGFLDRLDGVQAGAPNFSWHRFYYRRNGAIFLHGDVADRFSTAESLAHRRAQWLHRKQRGPVWQRLYDWAVAGQLHRPLPVMVYPRRTVARRILHYLRDIGQGPEAGVRHVYFGHTHREMSHYRYGGIEFHNGGAPIKGTRFRIVEAVVD